VARSHLVTEPIDPELHKDKRNSIDDTARIPSVNTTKNGGYNPQSPEKEDTVIFMHPEVAGVYNQGYDNESRTLDDSPERMDLNYASAEVVRQRSKGGYW